MPGPQCGQFAAARRRYDRIRLCRRAGRQSQHRQKHCFNALTGLRQHTGNWPGKTVQRAEGAFSFGGSKYKLRTLPGTYSLLSTSLDEEVARDFILFGQPT